MQHLLGFLRRDLDGGDRQELVEVFEDSRQGLVPLIVPVTLLRHHVRRCAGPDWMRRQVYLNPYPRELLLRNHV